MQYLLLIYEDEKNWEKMTEAEKGKIIAEYGQFGEQIQKNGNYLGSNRLQPISAATTVRVRNGKRLTTDGPFAETKEQLGGYYLIEAKNLDEAISIAGRIPSARSGSVEVRPIWPVTKV